MLAKSYETCNSELIDGDPKRRIRDEIESVRQKITDYSFFVQLRVCMQLMNFIYQQQKNINLLVDVHGYQIFANGIFNGDPHPGEYYFILDWLIISSTCILIN